MKGWQVRRARELAPYVLAAVMTAAVPEAAAAAPAAVAAIAEVVPASTLRSRKRRALQTANERTRYQAKYAHKRRLDLVRVLAPDGKCAGCGEIFEPESLTIQHAGESGCSFRHAELNQHRRAAAYWREHEAGVALEAMCGSCNSSDGYRLRGKWGRA